MNDRIDLSTESSMRKWCTYCNCWFEPRPCNADKQCHCCKTKDCKLASKRASNRKWHRNKSANDEGWRRKNVLRVLRWRRNVRYGFDVEEVPKSVELLRRHIAELLVIVDEVLPFLTALKALLFPIFLRKLPSDPVALVRNLGSSRDRVVSSSEKMVLQLKTIPGLTLLDSEMARCA